MSLILEQISKYNVGIQYNKIMDIAPESGQQQGQKRKRVENNEWEEHYSERMKRPYWWNRNTNKSLWTNSSISSFLPNPPVSSSSLPTELLKMPLYIPPATDAENTSSQIFKDFLKEYDTKKDSYADIQYYFSYIFYGILNKTNGQKKAIRYLIELFYSYVKYKKETNELPGKIGLYYYGNGHAGYQTAKLRNSRIYDLPKKITICTPPGCFSFGIIGKTCFEFFIDSVENDEKMTQKKKAPTRERTSLNYIHIKDEYDKKIISPLLNARGKISKYTNQKIPPQWEISKYIKIYIANLLTEVKLSQQWNAYVTSNQFDSKDEKEFTEDDFLKALATAGKILDHAIRQNENIKTNCGFAASSVKNAFKTINTEKMKQEKMKKVYSSLQLLYSDKDLNANFFLRFKVISDDKSDEYISLFNSTIERIRQYTKMLYMDKIIAKRWIPLTTDEEITSYQIEVALINSSKNDDIIREINQCDAIFTDKPGYTPNQHSMSCLFLTELHRFHNGNSLDLKKIVITDDTMRECLDPTMCFSLSSRIPNTSLEAYVVNGCREGCIDIRDPNESDIEEDSQTLGGARKTRKCIRKNKHNIGKTRGRK
jgi:hypothetical protein